MFEAGRGLRWHHKVRAGVQDSPREVHVVYWEAASGGAKNMTRFLWGKTYYRAPQKVGLVWSAPTSYKGHDRTSQNGRRGGEQKYHTWRGQKKFWGEGLYGMFSPPLSFPSPLCSSLSLDGLFQKRSFLHSFPLSGTPVVQSYWA